MDTTIAESFLNHNDFEASHLQLENPVDMSAKKDDYVCIRTSRFNALCVSKKIVNHAMNIQRINAGTDMVLGQDAQHEIVNSIPLFDPSSAVRMLPDDTNPDKCYQLQYKPLDFALQQMGDILQNGTDNGSNVEIQAILDAFKSTTAVDPAVVVCANSKSDSVYALTGMMKQGVDLFMQQSTLQATKKSTNNPTHNLTPAKQEFDARRKCSDGSSWSTFDEMCVLINPDSSGGWIGSSTDPPAGVDLGYSNSDADGYGNSDVLGSGPSGSGPSSSPLS